MSQTTRTQPFSRPPYQRPSLDFVWSDAVRKAEIPRRGTEGLGKPEVSHYAKKTRQFLKYRPKYTASVEEDIEYLRSIGYCVDYPKGRLGSGMFSVVYRGYYGTNVEDFENVEPSRRLAVKVVDFTKAGYTDSDRENFDSEKYILTKVSHRNIVQIRFIVNMGELHLKTFEDFPNRRYQSPDRAYLFMDFADEGEMEYYLAKNYNRIEPSQRIQFIRDLFFGMQYLHQQKIVHADVHIRNVLVFTEVNRLVAKWSDFGQSGIVDNKQYRYRRTQITRAYFEEESPFDIIGMTTIFDKILENRILGRPESPEEKKRLDECQLMVNKCRNVETIEEFYPFRHVLEDPLDL